MKRWKQPVTLYLRDFRGSSHPDECRPTGAAYKWQWVIFNIGNTYTYMFILVLCELPLPSAIYHSFLASPALQPVFLCSLLIIFFTVALFPVHKQLRVCIVFICSARTQLLSLYEPLLRRQAWVERPLGIGSRYCRTERWSVLEHCSSTE